MRDDHLVVQEPDVPVHVAEVGEHLMAVRTLVLRQLKLKPKSAQSNAILETKTGSVDFAPLEPLRHLLNL